MPQIYLRGTEYRAAKESSAISFFIPDNFIVGPDETGMCKEDEKYQ